MAVSTRLAPPNYKIYEPDSLDTIYAQKLFDPLEGGIAGAMMAAKGITDQGKQQNITDQQNSYNAMARSLDALEIGQKSQEARMKLAPGLLEHGTDAKDILGIDDILTPGGIAGNTASTAFQDLNKAKIAEALAKAAHAGDSGADTVQTQHTDPGTLNTIITTQKRKPGVLDLGTPSPTSAPLDPGTSTPAGVNPNAAQLDRRALAQRGIAAVGATDPKQFSAGQNTDGSFTFKNTANGKTATFDSNGKQIR